MKKINQRLFKRLILYYNVGEGNLLAQSPLVVMDAQADVEKIAGMVDFVFCAVDMKKDEIKALICLRKAAALHNEAILPRERPRCQ